MEAVRCAGALKVQRENLDEQLIKKVRKHRVLYDSGNVDYRNQNVRQIAWDEIASELNNLVTGKSMDRSIDRLICWWFWFCYVFWHVCCDGVDAMFVF